ncbi:MAG: hypothetical protein KA338_16620 [Chloroflexi bacterium]|nr:hypothetical protein [Chloroflexota bacterium]
MPEPDDKSRLISLADAATPLPNFAREYPMSPTDWRQSPAHLVFLAMFFKSRGRNQASPGNVDWKLLLGK